MKPHVSVLAMLSVASASSVAGAALGNPSYTQQEVWTSIALFNKANMPDGPSGSNTVTFVHGLMIVMGSNDSGQPPGTFHVFDVQDPHNPKRLKTYNSALTANLRELHAMPLAIIDGKIILVCPTTKGIAFFDFTDPMNPKDVGSLALPGVAGGDYTQVAWELSWSWPYVYVGSSGSGVDIVDATDPAAATLVKNIPTGQLGGFRVGPVHAAGNYLTVASMDQEPTKVSVLDVSDAKAPFLLTTGSTKSMYSSLTIGDMVFGVGVDGNYSFLKWTPDAVTVIAEKKFGSDKGGYCTYQDGFGFCGQSKEGFHKVDLGAYDAASIKDVGVGKTQGVADGDFDFATVLGNLVYSGNDHGSGAGLIPHQAAPDTTPPKVLKVYPGDQAKRQPLSTRVTMFFTDEIDIDTVQSHNLIVRKNGGSPLLGAFSHSSFNAVSFGAKNPLDANSTYEVIIKAGGVKDLAGNLIADDTVIRFSTGDVIDDAGAGGGGPSDDAGSDAGGAAGAGGSGSTGGGGSVDSGGTVNPGGSAGTGGDIGTGGIHEGTGGSAGKGQGESGDPGGSCSMPRRTTPRGGGLWSLLAAALWMTTRRVRRRPAWLKGR